MIIQTAKLLFNNRKAMTVTTLIISIIALLIMIYLIIKFVTYSDEPISVISKGFNSLGRRT